MQTFDQDTNIAGTGPKTLATIEPHVPVTQWAWKTIYNALDSLLDRASRECIDPPDVPEIEGAAQALKLMRKIQVPK